MSPVWFESAQNVSVAQDVDARGTLSGATGSAGALETESVERWIVRFTEQAVAEGATVQRGEHFLDQLSADFQVIRGLGLPGQLLVHSFASTEAARSVLADNPHVAYFEPDSMVHAQRIPDDNYFSSQTALDNRGQSGSTPDVDIDAPEAWDVTAGSPGVVVGVIDSGIDLAHPDLYLNVWINQGEIPEETASQLTDTDDDGLITFYDLNTRLVPDDANSSLVHDSVVEDRNGNKYIDALDLLQDPRWVDGYDTDDNGFSDDFFGWNFRASSDEPFALNHPGDVLGHGTHVAGIIGAVGDNGTGIAGVNWQSSIMALKFLDEHNRGQISDAIAAINYAKMMRSEMGVNVRVLNNSWGQTGGYSPNLEAAMGAAGDAGILSVAAAGNGNVLGQGIDIDRTPFFPASYGLDNVISVTATDSSGELTPFANFGVSSVDIAAPGVGIWSTLPGGRYGTMNGTSMAAPHVSGAAALIWSRGDYTVDEVRSAILQSATDSAGALEPDLTGLVATGGSVKARGSLDADVFVPRARLGEVADVVSPGDTSIEIVVTYTDDPGIDASSFGVGDIQVLRQWGEREELRVDAFSVLDQTIEPGGPKVYQVTYSVQALGGSWDATDFGEYEVHLRAGEITNVWGHSAAPRILGAYEVRMEDPSVIYVDSLADAPDTDLSDGKARDEFGNTTLRAAVQQANADFAIDGIPRTIILERKGTFAFSIEGQEDNAAAGDLDVTGDITVVGSGQGTTTIDASRLDRVFDAHPDSRLVLRGITCTGGYSSTPGGGIANQGDLEVVESTITNNRRIIDTDVEGYRAVGGAGIVNHGQLLVDRSTVSYNAGDNLYGWNPGKGGGIANLGIMTVRQSTIANNQANWGGGIAHESSVGASEIVNSTISGNFADLGGGLGIGQGGTLSIENTTITDNYADEWGGAIDISWNAGPDTMWMKNSVVAGNHRGGNTVSGEFQSAGYNLFDDAFVENPLDRLDPFAANYIGPLQDNGGPTQTHALLIGSSAIDTGEADDVNQWDQRGSVRDNQCANGTMGCVDIGAYEVTSGSIRGVRFSDLNGDGFRDRGEPGIAGSIVFLDANGDGELGPGEHSTTTSRDNPDTVDVDETGRFRFDQLPPLEYDLHVAIEDSWRRTLVGRPGLHRVSVATSRAEANDGSYTEAPSISQDGRFIVFTSPATDLIQEDTGGTQDVFLHDRQRGTTERITALTLADPEPTGDSWDASISDDGSRIVFTSRDRNLVSDSTPQAPHLFAYDRTTKQTEIISIAPDGSLFDQSRDPTLTEDGSLVAFCGVDYSNPGDQCPLFVRDLDLDVTVPVDITMDGVSLDLVAHSISADGRIIAFLASWTPPGASDSEEAYFVCDRDQGTTEYIARREATGGVFGGWEPPSLSADGRFIAFATAADDVVSGDLNRTEDVFVFDRQTHSFDRVSRNQDGTETNRESAYPSISAEGRYVTFLSRATTIVPNDTTFFEDVFFADRETGFIEQVSMADDGTRASAPSFWAPSLSADGRYVAFCSTASNLVTGDNNRAADVFVKSTAAVAQRASESIVLDAGENVQDIYFGDYPLPGEIRGLVYRDAIQNGTYDPGEPGFANWIVYLDLHENGQRDSEDPWTTTGADGTYVLQDIDAETEYLLSIESVSGWAQVFPAETQGGSWRLFLPAGETIRGRDFGFSQADSGGQSKNARVSGRLFRDDNGNGAFDDQSGESGLADWKVFLDLNDDSQWQNVEPRQMTASDDMSTSENESGMYSFAGLGTGTRVIRVLPQPGYRQTVPLGNEFTDAAYQVELANGAPGSLYDVAVSDFNNDGLPDLAVALYEGNAVSLLLNDGQGGFGDSPIDIDLATAGASPSEPIGTNPVAIFAGDLNGKGSPDLAVANHTTNNVAILLDLNGAGFSSKYFVTVGGSPNSITGGDTDNDGTMDFLAVTNGFDNTVSILRKDGDGFFAADPGPIAVGEYPSSVIAGHFNPDEDSYVDLAVVDYGSQGDWGDLRILLSDGPSSFRTVQPLCDIGIGPANLAASDFDGDGKLDLAVANFRSSTVTICQGNGDGRFPGQQTLSTGLGPMDVEVADLDGDTKLDLLVANVTSNNVTMHRNRSTLGSFDFEPGESYGAARFTGGARLAMDVGDFDGSGIPDLAITDNTERTVSVHLNTLVGGARRVGLSGVEDVSGLDFGLMPLNATPTLDVISNPAPINEDTGGEQTLSLTGISAGDGEEQSLIVTTSTDNAPMLSSLSVDYASPAPTGILRYTLVENQHGTAIVTVTVTDAGLDGDLATTADNAFFSRYFSVTVNTLNDLPTLDAIPDQGAIDESSPQQTANLSGISAGGGESQPLRLTVSSSNTDLIPNPTIHYNSPDPTGTLTYTPVPNRNGMAIIKVTVTDGGLDKDLSTEGDNLSFQQSFAVGVNPSDEVNAAPTAVTLDNMSVGENLPGAIIGNLNVVDPDVGDTHVLTVADPRFEVFDGQLKLKTGRFLDHETEPTLTVYMTAMDAGGLWLTQDFALTVNDGNDAPTAVFVIDENAEGEMVGSLAVDDQDASDIHTFAAMDSRFEVVNGQLKLRAGHSLDHEAEPTINLDVKVTDGGGLSYTQSLAIRVRDVNERPVVTSTIADQESEENQPFALSADVFTDYDDGDQDQLTYQVRLSDGTALPEWLSFGQAKLILSGMPLLGDQGQLSVRVMATDLGGLSGDTMFTISVAGDPYPWQNPRLDPDARFDVDDNRLVTPLDVLNIIAYINANGSGALPRPSHPSEVERRFYDVHADNLCTPLDVLELIGRINARIGSGEAEADRPSRSSLAALQAVTGFLTGTLQATQEAASPWTQPRQVVDVSPAHEQTSVSSDARRMRKPRTHDIRTFPAIESHSTFDSQLEDVLSQIANDVADAFAAQAVGDQLFSL